MQSIKADLPRSLDFASIHLFSDLHIGDSQCDLKAIQSHIDLVKGTPNAYALLLGDIMNNATKTSVSDCYSEKLSPMQQLETFITLFEPIKDKILIATSGNHENRTYIKEGIDLTAVAMKELGILDKYACNGGVLFIRVGENKYNHRQISYSIYCKHGSGSGKSVGSKLNALENLSSIVDTDIVIAGHTHLPAIFKESFFRTDFSSRSVVQVERLFVNSSAQLEYGGYGEAFGFKPASKECPIIYLSGKHKNFYAHL